MKAILCVLVLVNIISCGYNDTKMPAGAENNSSSGGAAGGFESVKSQIFQPTCIRCHSSAGGNRGGVNLETYTNVKALLTKVQSAVNSGAMPPSGALPTGLKNVLNSWISQGAPEFSGDGGNTVPPGGTNPPPPPGDDQCAEDLQVFSSDLLIQVQDEIYFNKEDQSLVRIQRRGGDCK